MKLLLLNTDVFKETWFLLPFIPYIVIGLAAILEAIFDRHKPPVKMPEPKKAKGMRVGIAIFSGVLLLSYFLPWMEANYADGYYSMQKRLDLLGVFNIYDFYGTSLVEEVFFAFLVLLLIATILSCFLNIRNMYRWFASFPLQFIPLFLSSIWIDQANSGEFAAHGTSLGPGTFLAFIACVLIFLTTIIDIIVHAKECKWLILYLSSIFIILLFGITLLMLSEFLDNMEISPLFAFAILIIPAMVIVYFIAKLWKREEKSVTVLHTTSPTGNISSGESPSSHSLDKTSITSDTAESEAKPSDHSRYMPSASNRLANRMRGFVPAQTKPETPPEPQPQVRPRPLQPVVPVPEKTEMTTPTGKNSKQTSTMILVAAMLLLLGGGTFGYFQWYVPYKTDRDAPRYYTVVNLNLRSAPYENAPVVAVLPYASELIVYGINTGWASGKWGNHKGYASLPYLLPKEDFFLLNSMFGDAESRECVETAKCRLALIQYYRERRLYGKAGAEMPEGYVYGEKNWQIFTKNKNVKPNAVFFPRIYNRNSKFTDFAVIIKNTDTGERRLLLFTFDDETEAATLIYEEKAPATGDIQNIASSGSSVRVTYTY